jgi:hypothetical protein
MPGAMGSADAFVLILLGWILVLLTLFALAKGNNTI